MPEFSLHAGSEIPDAEVIALYESVGWSPYTRNPEVLVRATRGSAFVVVTCRVGGGELVGLARAISDEATICYVQDILVRPSFQGSGAGRAMLEAIQSRYRHVRQTVLITDDQPGQRAFYQALGFTEGSDFSPEPLRMFARFHRPLSSLIHGHARQHHSSLK
jgi:N-acetylglutamate synthase-like GNAT family acetyltransferase